MWQKDSFPQGWQVEGKHVACCRGNITASQTRGTFIRDQKQRKLNLFCSLLYFKSLLQDVYIYDSIYSCFW